MSSHQPLGTLSPAMALAVGNSSLYDHPASRLPVASCIGEFTGAESDFIAFGTSTSQCAPGGQVAFIVGKCIQVFLFVIVGVGRYQLF